MKSAKVKVPKQGKKALAGSKKLGKSSNKAEMGRDNTVKK